MSPPRAPRVGFVSLGCPKALVDSERILTHLRAEGYEVVPTYDAADGVVVNTCGLIDGAGALPRPANYRGLHGLVQLPLHTVDAGQPCEPPDARGAARRRAAGARAREAVARHLAAHARVGLRHSLPRRHLARPVVRNPF